MIAAQIVLQEDMFTNNKFIYSHGGNEILFTIVDEVFSGHNRLGRINRITILSRRSDASGQMIDEGFRPTVIGMGDGIIGIKSGAPELRGQLLTKDNMDRCIIEVYEAA